MRKIIFRGKRKDSNEFIYGYLYDDGMGNKFIMNYEQDGNYNIFDVHFEIIPETIGQFTSLKDKNGKEIYEGDILSIRKKIIGKIIYSHDAAAYCIETKHGTRPFIYYMVFTSNIEVVGNIYDNIELLNE